MGLKDHLEDETGHILRLGLDLDYLHVDGAERQAGPDAAAVAGSVGAVQVSGTWSSSSCSSCSNLSEDSEDERLHAGSQANAPLQDRPSGPDLAPERPPDDPAGPPPPSDPVTDCRSKVEFALKLGYSEDLVLLVLRKLGAGALINDILGELVKLGTKSETEHHGGPTGSPSSFSSFSSPSSSLACSSSSSSSTSSSSFSSSSLDACRLLSPSQLAEDKENLRPVVVDGSNMAMSHGNKEVFSCQGIQLAVDWFLDRGHRDITVFVPAWRKEQSRPDALITDQEILRRLEKEKLLVFTPSRRVQGRRVVCYDDRFIVKLAYESDGIIVSNDNYRDLANEKPEWKKFIDERLLMYSFVNDKFMPPDDPLGRHGPSLENFLRKRPVIPEHRKQPCPYGKKCTYGHKCKFFHPERGGPPQRAVADELRASARTSWAACRGLLEQALTTSGDRGPAHSEGRSHAEAGLGAGGGQPDPDPRAPSIDLVEDGVQAQSKARECGGAGGGLGLLALGGLLSSGCLDQWEQLGGVGGRSSRGVPGPNRAEFLLRCESPETGFGSLVQTCSSLALSAPRTPECFGPASLLSDCGSEAGSDSFCPETVLDESPKCLHHLHRLHPPPPPLHHPPHHHHHHLHYPDQLAPLRGCVSPGLGQAFPSTYSVPPGLRRPRGLRVEDPLAPPDPGAPLSFHASPRSFETSLSYFPPQRPSLGSFLGELPPELPHPPQAPPIHSQTFPMGRTLLGPLWPEDGPPDSRVYQGSPLHSRRSYSGLNHQPQHPVSWDPEYQSTPEPHYEPRSCRSPPQLPPWTRPVHPAPSPAGRPCLSAQRSPQESAGLARYQDLRQRLFVNLCGIFPPDLVRAVMTRNPLMMDAQELAATILLEKSHRGS